VSNGGKGEDRGRPKTKDNHEGMKRTWDEMGKGKEEKEKIRKRKS